MFQENHHTGRKISHYLLVTVIIHQQHSLVLYCKVIAEKLHKLLYEFLLRTIEIDL